MPIKIKTSKRNRDYTQVAFVNNSTLTMRGRKGIIRETGIGSKSRSPLTVNLLATLNHPDSYVVVPLGGTRTKHNTVYNMQDKAKRAGVELNWTLAPDQKAIYAWFSRKQTAGKKSASSNGVADSAAV
jgi:outer membrane receptor protein involved in Fe transport